MLKFSAKSGSAPGGKLNIPIGTNKKNSGFALVELVVAIGIITTILFSALQFINTTTRAMRTERYIREATLLMAEWEDAVKFLRDAGWNTYISPITPETTYYLSFSGSNWTFGTSDPGSINNHYTRSFVFHQVFRDASGNIVQSGGSADANSRRVTATLSWQGVTGPQTLSNDFYVNNILRN